MQFMYTSTFGIEFVNTKKSQSSIHFSVQSRDIINYSKGAFRNVLNKHIFMTHYRETIFEKKAEIQTKVRRHILYFIL